MLLNDLIQSDSTVVHISTHNSSFIRSMKMYFTYLVIEGKMLMPVTCEIFFLNKKPPTSPYMLMHALRTALHGKASGIPELRAVV